MSVVVRAPHQNVAQVQFPVSTPYAGEIFFVGTLVFLSPLKPTFPNSNLTSDQLEEEPLCGCVMYF